MWIYVWSFKQIESFMDGIVDSFAYVRLTLDNSTGLKAYSIGPIITFSYACVLFLLLVRLKNIVDRQISNTINQHLHSHC